MSHDHFDNLAPFITAAGTFAFGIFILGTGLILTAIVAIASGSTYAVIVKKLR